MKRYAAFFLFTLLLLTAGGHCAMAQQKSKAKNAANVKRPVNTDSIAKLTKEMYRLYPTRDTANFMRITEQLKKVSLQAGDERTFYKA